MHDRWLTATIAAVAFCATTGPAQAQADAIAALRAELTAQRAQLAQQQQLIAEQRERLNALERRQNGERGSAMVSSSPGVIPLPASPPPEPPARTAGVDRTVGQAPTDQRQVQVAVLSEQGGIITKPGRLTLEGAFEYARADRNRVVFRGVEIPQSVLIGVFDINESRQDVLTAGLVARLGLTGRLELNARIPYVYRSDKSVLAPVADPNNPNAGQIDRPVSGSGIGDIDFGVRYQFTDGSGGWPYLIAGIQAIAPTGRNPFTVPRDALGNALEVATGAGFWGVAPSLTAILPSDPSVLFATLGYTYNAGKDIGRLIGPTFVERVKPGGEPNASVGIAVALNPRTSLSLGYAHTWSTGTLTRLRNEDPQTGVLGESQKIRSRDLQLGRLLFGVSYRTSPRTTINWNVEVGATDDATDLRTTLRIPLIFDLY